jgi:hypothetical protein
VLAMARLLVMVMLRAMAMLRALQLLIRVMPKFHARTSRRHHFQVVFGVKAYCTAVHTECTQAWLRGVYEIHNLVPFSSHEQFFFIPLSRCFGSASGGERAGWWVAS